MPSDFMNFLQQGNQVEKSPFLKWLDEQKKEESPFLRYIASQEELKETQKGLLAKAQEKVKYKFAPEEIKAQADSPKTWGAETWSSVGEQMRELPAAEFFTKDFWTETGKKYIKDAYELIKEETGDRQARWIERTARVVGQGSMYAPALKAIEGSEGRVSPIREAGVEIGRTAIDYVSFIPKTAFNLAKDPINTIKKDLFSVSMLIGAIAGVKAVKGVRAKIKAKNWVTTGDFIDPILKSKMVTKELKARLREVPSDIELELGDVPLEIVKFKKGGKMPFYKHHWEGMKRDMKTMGDLPDRWTKYKKNIGLRIPLRTFEQYPWMKRVFYDEWRTGEFNGMVEATALKNEFRVWNSKLKKEVLGRKSQERVGVHADYMQEGGAEVMQHMMKVAKEKGRNWKKFEQPELTAVEMEYYNWGQKVFRDFLPRLNRVRALAGQKPIGKVANYSTWIRNLSELDSLGIDILKASAEQVEFQLNSTALSFAKHRAKGVVKAGIELDYGLLLENYSRQAIRNIHVSPAIIKARTFLEPFKLEAKHIKKGEAGIRKGEQISLKKELAQTVKNWDKMLKETEASLGKGEIKPKDIIKTEKITWDVFEEAPRLATWLEQWTDAIAGQTRAIPTGGLGKTVKIMNKLNRNIAIAILSYNFRSALIQPTAFKLSYTMLGRKYLVDGFMKNLTKEGRAFADANSQHLLARKQGMMDVHVAEAMQAQLGKKLGRTKQALGQAGMFGLQWLDYQTARATWLGAYEMATKKLGYKPKRARIWADDLTVKTQASAQIGDIAPIQRTPLGKFATLFQTFVINEYDFLTHDVFGYKNPYMNMATRQKNIGRFILSSVVVNAVYEGIFKIRSPYPAPLWSIKRSVEEGDSFLQGTLGVAKELAEQYPIWGGTARWSTPYRIAFPAFAQKVIVDPYQMFERLVAKPSLTRDQLEWMATILGVPGTSQVMKYLRRRKRGQNHMEAILGVRAETRGKKRASW